MCLFFWGGGPSKRRSHPHRRLFGGCLCSWSGLPPCSTSRFTACRPSFPVAPVTATGAAEAAEAAEAAAMARTKRSIAPAKPSEGGLSGWKKYYLTSGWIQILISGWISGYGSKLAPTRNWTADFSPCFRSPCWVHIDPQPFLGGSLFRGPPQE